MNIELMIQGFIEQYGLLSVFIIVLLEYSNLPIPSEVILPLVGMLVAVGDIAMWEAVLVTVLAGVLGSLFNYFLGFCFGKPLVKWIVNKYPKLNKSVDSSMWWINKYGNVSVLLSRIVPIARTFVSIPAGVIRMKLGPFIVYSALGIGIWNSILIYLGLLFGNNFSVIMATLEKYAIVFALVIFTIVMIIRSRKMKRTG